MRESTQSNSPEVMCASQYPHTPAMLTRSRGAPQEGQLSAPLPARRLPPTARMKVQYSLNTRASDLEPPTTRPVAVSSVQSFIRANTRTVTDSSHASRPTAQSSTRSTETSALALRSPARA